MECKSTFVRKLLPDPGAYSEKRLFALDFLRGADMLVLVAWYAIGTAIGKAYELGDWWMYQFKHPWIGFTLWDFISPLFLFVVGAAVPLALAKRLTEEGKTGWNYWKHVLARIAMLWVLGGIVQCAWLTFDPMKMTPYGNTLQTISIGYFLSALIYPIRRAWVRWAIIVAGVAAYQIPLCIYGNWTAWGSLVAKIELPIWRAILPEGNVYLGPWWWGITRFIGIPMFLFMCGTGMESTILLLRKDLSQWRKAGWLSAVGVVLCLLGFFFWKVLDIPLLKQLYTISIMCFTQGLCLLLLAATYVVTDIWKFRRGTGVVLLWGQCALFAYFVSHVFSGMYTSVTASCLRGLPRLISDQRIISVIHPVFSMAVLTFLMAVWRQFRASMKNTGK